MQREAERIWFVQPWDQKLKESPRCILLPSIWSVQWRWNQTHLEDTSCSGHKLQWGKLDSFQLDIRKKLCTLVVVKQSGWDPQKHLEKPSSLGTFKPTLHSLLSNLLSCFVHSCFPASALLWLCDSVHQTNGCDVVVYISSGCSGFRFGITVGTLPVPTSRWDSPVCGQDHCSVAEIFLMTEGWLLSSKPWLGHISPTLFSSLSHLQAEKLLP